MRPPSFRHKILINLAKDHKQRLSSGFPILIRFLHANEKFYITEQSEAIYLVVPQGCGMYMRSAWNSKQILRFTFIQFCLIS